MTIFEKILQKEIPAHIIYEDDYAVAFHDIEPQAPIHVLVIPKHPATDFTDLAQWNPLSVGHYMHAIDHVIQELKLENGYRLIFNTGKEGGQTVPYLHAHILAGKMLGWPPFPA